jgi:hypothetical protein
MPLAVAGPDCGGRRRDPTAGGRLASARRRADGAASLRFLPARVAPASALIAPAAFATYASTSRSAGAGGEGATADLDILRERTTSRRDPWLITASASFSLTTASLADVADALARGDGRAARAPGGGRLGATCKKRPERERARLESRPPAPSGTGRSIFRWGRQELPAGCAPAPRHPSNPRFSGRRGAAAAAARATTVMVHLFID